jgi:hypothetical protein
MILFSFYPQASDVGETQGLFPGTVDYLTVPSTSLHFIIPHKFFQDIIIIFIGSTTL